MLSGDERLHRQAKGRLTDKVCVITGSGGSMGRVASLLFASEGAQIVGCDITAASAEDTMHAVRSAGGEMVSMHPCDLTQPDECRGVVELALKTYGRLDLLYNNAAMAWFGPIEQFTTVDWRRTIDAELDLVFYMCRAAWSALSKQGGAILNIASVSGWRGSRTLPGLAHTAAKGGVIAMTRQLAVEGGRLGIRVNSLSPGLVETTQTAAFLSNAAWRASMEDRIILARAAKPEEIAHAALFLLSGHASYITGADLCVDGGGTAW